MTNEELASVLGLAFKGKKRAMDMAKDEAERARREANDASARGWLQSGLKGAAIGGALGSVFTPVGTAVGAGIGGVGGALLGLMSAAKDRRADEGGSLSRAFVRSLGDPMGGQGAGSAMDAGLPLAQTLAYSRLAAARKAPAVSTPAESSAADQARQLIRDTSLRAKMY